MSTPRPRGRTPLVRWILALCLLVPASIALAVGTAAAQDGPSSTQPAAGQPTASQPATSAVPSTTQAPALKERVSDSEAATTRLNRIVIALLVLAVVIAVVTVVFWRMTRPDRRRATSSAAFWVDESGAEVPLPADDDHGVDAADAGPAVDPEAWTVGEAPRIAPLPVPALPGAAATGGVAAAAGVAVATGQANEAGDDDADDIAGDDAGEGTGRDQGLDPLPTRTPGSGPYPGRADPAATSDRNGPVVVVEPVSPATRVPATPAAPAAGSGSAGSWASQGWGGDDAGVGDDDGDAWWDTLDEDHADADDTSRPR